jgi:hypothetical protein
MKSRSAFSSIPNFSRSRVRLPLSRRRYAEVDHAPAHPQLDAAVLRHPPLGDVQVAQDLEARDQRRLHLDRRPHDLHQHAVDAVADADVLLVALEVDVRRPAVHRVGEDAVDQLDHRRLLHRRRQRADRKLLLAVLDDLHVLGLDLLEQVVDLFVRAALVLLLDDLAQREVARDHRLDVQAGDELEVVQHPQVRGVGHRHRERAPHPAQRQHLVADGDLAGNELEDLGVQPHPLQVHRGNAVLAGERAHQVLLAQEAELDEAEAHANAVGARVVQRLGKLLAADEALVDQLFANPVCGSGNGHLALIFRAEMPGRGTCARRPAELWGKSGM